ncbi:VOC family protein [Salsipaludibacter albus]|uniref:VOC family protein n=1 Tax=Salsipaludibacter albus TaxID=2849650 RepID=UPI001EE3B882|nr:VOC family protein [Salsipaludibacter albus]MBY5162827.1 VOC family protein [Salsipaludibacter albus]
MSQLDRFIPGVPCWVEAHQPDPVAAGTFYAGLFGWDCKDTMPADSPDPYLVARLDGRDVAAIGPVPEWHGSGPTWITYVRVATVDDAVARAVEAGGRVLSEASDVGDSGRMAAFADPEGAVLCVWEAARFPGAEAVNEHGAVIFNDLATPDLAGAEAFYGAVFGWGLLGMGDGAMWVLPGYGDHLEQLRPGTLDGLDDGGTPAGYENVVASVRTIPDDPDDGSAGWGVTFGVDDTDAIAARAEELGGTVLQPPMDLPWVRMCVIADPQGAVFTASQYVPDNAPEAGVG